MSAVEVNQDTKAEIDRGLRARGSIALGYNRLRSQIFDLVYCARSEPWYAEALGGCTHGEASIEPAQLLLSMLHLTPDVYERAREALAVFESLHAAFGPVALGFAEVVETRSNTLIFRFQLGGRRLEFTASELDEEATKLASILPVAVESIKAVQRDAFTNHI